jgi:L-rhamnose mutarotase
MKKIGMTWDVKPEHWEEYRDIHLNAAEEWPELLEAFAQHGVHNFNCFAFGYRIFAYLEIRDEDEVYDVLEKVAQTPIKKKWDVKVMPWLKPKAAEESDVQFLEIERIFYSP